MNLREFEEGYAQRSEVTVEWLHEHGRYGVPCDCGEELCEGWQMLHDDGTYAYAVFRLKRDWQYFIDTLLESLKCRQ